MISFVIPDLIGNPVSNFILSYLFWIPVFTGMTRLIITV